MVGLSVILENYRDLSEKRSPQVISKGIISMIKQPPHSNPSSPTSTNGFFRRKQNVSDPSSSSSSACGFLECCFLCRKKLLPGNDIYMYKGDTAFCSVECRYKQIFMDEEEASAKSSCTLEYNCSAPSSSSSARTAGKGPRNRAHAFA
ncbi:Protein of unknown function (DUF581 [Striga hermonthica]|uniref:FLZ-type domain-containing protein n=1 Tax=Striga hermonthica TaxID=68872 RepID=A0A9N7MWY8_STRHE|nr:Protein of unknown function (DUF581 [Striga hermonthica]